MLNYLNLLEQLPLVTTVEKMDILSPTALPKETSKEQREEAKVIIEILTKDTIQITTKEKEPQDLITNLEIINGNRETDLKVMKEPQTITEIGIEMREAEAAQETTTRLIEKVNTNEYHHLTLEMSTILIMIKMKMNSK